jgi:hypothetical protein
MQIASPLSVDLFDNGLFVQQINIGQGVNRHSTILANICELQQPEGEPLDFPFIGAALMRINNIAPLDDGSVLIYVEIDWNWPIPYRIRLAVWP